MFKLFTHTHTHTAGDDYSNSTSHEFYLTTSPYKLIDSLQLSQGKFRVKALCFFTLKSTNQKWNYAAYRIMTSCWCRYKSLLKQCQFGSLSIESGCSGWEIHAACGKYRRARSQRCCLTPRRFLIQTLAKLVRLIGHFKLAIGVSVSIPGCLSLSASPTVDWWSPPFTQWQLCLAQTENWWMDLL